MADLCFPVNCSPFLKDLAEENLRQAINNLMKNLKLTSKQALEALGIPQNEWEKYKPV